MSEITLYAFALEGKYRNESVEIPSALYRNIESTIFKSRWFPNIPDGEHAEQGFVYGNILNFKKYTGEHTGVLMYTGEMVEMSADEIALIDVDGEKYTHNPRENGQGLSKSWKILIAPNNNLLIIANGAVNQKVSRYLSSVIDNYYRQNPQTNDKIDDIEIFAKLNDATPEGFLRKHPDLKSIEFKLDASAFNHDYGFFQSGLIGEQIYGDSNSELVIKISISSSRRGGQLPTVLTEHLAEFLNQASEKSVIYSAKASDIQNGRKMKAKTILNALQTEHIIAETETELETKMINYALKVIDLENDD